jgi:hypothetical protein
MKGSPLSEKKILNEKFPKTGSVGKARTRREEVFQRDELQFLGITGCRR